jgi:Double-stranded RNA binding motif
MNALQQLNEQLQARGLGPAEFTYVKTGTDHFPNFQASTVLNGVKYTGEVRGTKKLAARSCAEAYLSSNTIAPQRSHTTLIVDHTDETVEQLIEFAKLHKFVHAVTDDAKTIAASKQMEFEAEFSPTGVNRAIVLVLAILTFYDDTAGGDKTDIVVKTKNPEVIAYVNAMKSGQVGYYRPARKSITIV